jgi:hypothetical protein
LPKYGTDGSAQIIETRANAPDDIVVAKLAPASLLVIEMCIGRQLFVKEPNGFEINNRDVANRPLKFDRTRYVVVSVVMVRVYQIILKFYITITIFSLPPTIRAMDFKLNLSCDDDARTLLNNRRNSPTFIFDELIMWRFVGL